MKGVINSKLQKEKMEQKKKKKSEMSVLERVQELQRKLYLKAKQERGYKFYVLYDKVFVWYVLEESWKRVKQQGGSAGVDGQTISDIEESGVKPFLEELKEDLRKHTYQAQALKRVEAEKEDGGTRPISIPTVRDRVAQMACKIVIEPLYEADFGKDSYGFRPKRSAGQAIKEVKESLKGGQTEVYDVDLSKYFDTIPHAKLEIALRERISDKRILDLIKKWLRAPVREDGQDKGGRKKKVGVPQGGVISPLLSNIYLNLLDRIVAHPGSIFGRQDIRMIRYADDFVLLGRQISEEVLDKLKELLDRMDLRINEKKSRRLRAQEERFNFLGFSFSYDRCLYHPKTKRYWNVGPSPKSQKRLRTKLRNCLSKIGHYPPALVAKQLNEIQRGWLNYFDIKGVSYTRVARAKLRYYLQYRLYKYYNRKSQRRSRLYRQQAFEQLVNRYGLIDPTKT